MELLSSLVLHKWYTVIFQQTENKEPFHFKSCCHTGYVPGTCYKEIDIVHPLRQERVMLTMAVAHIQKQIENVWNT